ncbi:MAG: hypothetical protein Q8P18_27935 [Pseudomonadota bacterium]|nr:hypothetical protein [Pseudomonadota bacterium]
MESAGWSVDQWLLFAVGFGAATCLWIGLAWIPHRLAPVNALRAFASARGARVRGDGRVEPLSILGVARGRPFTVTWQRPAGGGDVLLVGVDCLVADGAVAAGDEAGGVTSAEGDALVTRWVRPGADVLEPARLGEIVDALAQMAEELEAAHPSFEEEPE